MTSTSAGKPKAEELIAQFEQHQQSQLGILRALHGLSGGAEGNDEVQQNKDESAETRPPPPEQKKKESCTPGRPGDERQEFPPDFDISSLSMPDEWAQGWSDRLLKERIEERRGDKETTSSPPWERFPVLDPNEPAVKFIEEEVLKDFSQFSDALDRPNETSRAFSIVDSAVPVSGLSTGLSCSVGMPKPEDFLPDSLPNLAVPRSVASSFGRHIIIQSLTPSAIAAVLLSAPKDPSYDYFGVYMALRRYLSTETRERFKYSAHGYSRGDLRSQYLQIGFISVSFFSISGEKTAPNQSPFSPIGAFGTPSPSQQFIRERKFTFSFTKCGIGLGPSLAVTLGALTWLGPRQADDPISSWITNNLRHIWFEWRDVLDYMDEQLSLPTSVIFHGEEHQTAPFAPGGFMDARKRAWALQTLLVFEDFIEKTLEVLPGILSLSRSFDDSTCSEWEEEKQKENFTGFKARIVKRREQIEVLNNALASQ